MKKNDPPFYIGVLGPEGSFTSAAFKRFKTHEVLTGRAVSMRYADSISQALSMVADGAAEFGCVPLRNSVTGPVRESQEVAAHFEIVATVAMPIEYVLAATSAHEQNIKKVFSHFQALAQCKESLQKYVPHAAIETVPSTAAAMHKVYELITREGREDVAALGSRFAAARARLPILRERMEDSSYNETTFALFRKR